MRYEDAGHTDCLETLLEPDETRRNRNDMFEIAGVSCLQDKQTETDPWYSGAMGPGQELAGTMALKTAVGQRTSTHESVLISSDVASATSWLRFGQDLSGFSNEHPYPDSFSHHLSQPIVHSICQTIWHWNIFPGQVFAKTPCCD